MITLAQYQAGAVETARSGQPNWKSILLLGIQGEVGSLLAEHKKKIRDGVYYVGHTENFREELGDILWYMANIASFCGISLEEICDRSQAGTTDTTEALIQLSITAGVLVEAMITSQSSIDSLKKYLSNMISLALIVAEKNHLDFGEVLSSNLRKVRGRWLAQPESAARCFDSGEPIWERLPRRGNITFIQHSRGPEKPPFVVIRMNELNIGDRLTDNAYQDDGYRFHDTFHLAYASVLGWSPVTRALFKNKRKSDPKKDENEDGARAQIIEEAIAFQVYDYARAHSFLDGHSHVDHNLLKTIVGLCRGLEVASCAPWEWELAIVRGYEVFRGLRQLAQRKTRFGVLVDMNADERVLRLGRELTEDELGL